MYVDVVKLTLITARLKPKPKPLVSRCSLRVDTVDILNIFVKF